MARKKSKKPRPRLTGICNSQYWDKTSYKPWGLQKELQQQELPNQEEISILVSNIKEVRTKALVVLLYLTAGRISEVCYHLKKKHLNLVYQKGRSILLIRLKNVKHRKRHFKDLPIPVDKEDFLLEHLNQYLATKHPKDVLFNFGKTRAYQIIRQATGWNNHWLRHLRATHLVLYHDFNEQLLIKFMGWTNSLPAKHYMELKWTDILDKY